MTTPRTITKASIESRIRSVHYVNVGAAVLGQQPVDTKLTHEDLGELSLVTMCFIIMENGFKVEGVSACVDPAKYNQELGQQFAYQNAFEKLWQLEGYLLKDHMHQEAETADMLADLQEAECDGCKI